MARKTLMTRGEVRRKVRNFVVGYVRCEVDSRVDVYVDKYMRSTLPMMGRSIKYAVPDLAVSVRNVAGFFSAKLGLKDFRTTTYAKDFLTERFMDEVFQRETFEKRFQGFLEREAFEPFRAELVRVAARARLDSRKGEFEKELRKRLNDASKTGEISSKTVLSILDVAIGSLVAAKAGGLMPGNPTRNLGATAGAATANALYLSQAGLFSSLWASLFGVPAWVSGVGVVAGTTLALVVVTPMVGALLQRVTNGFVDIPAKIRKGYPAMIDVLVDGDPAQGEQPSLFKSAEEIFSAFAKATSKLLWLVDTAQSVSQGH